MFRSGTRRPRILRLQRASVRPERARDTTGPTPPHPIPHPASPLTDLTYFPPTGRGECIPCQGSEHGREPVYVLHHRNAAHARSSARGRHGARGLQTRQPAAQGQRQVPPYPHPPTPTAHSHRGARKARKTTPAMECCSLLIPFVLISSFLSMITALFKW